MKNDLIYSILNSIRYLALYDSAEIFNFASGVVVKEEVKLQKYIEDYIREGYDFIELLKIFDKNKIEHSYHVKYLPSRMHSVHYLTIITLDIII